MIQIATSGKVVTFKMIGTVTQSDWDAVLPEFEEALGAQTSVRFVLQKKGAFRVLMDWEHLQEWDKGSRSTCTWFCKGNQDLVGRVAIIGDARWRDEEGRMADVYKNARVLFFTPSERDQALAWLQGQ
jgi:hypothetical protein